MPGPDPRRQSLDSRNKMGAFPKEAIKREKIIFSLKKDKPKPEQPKTKSVAKPNKFLSGGQSKLDKNKNNKIDAEDFALLRKEKSKDKPMKAKRGMSTDDFVKRRKKLMGIRAVGPAAGMMGSGVASQAQVKQGTKRLGGKGRVGTAAALGAAGVSLIAKKIKERMDKRKAKKRDTAKVKKMGGGLAAATERLRAQGKMGGGMMKKYSVGGGADSGRIGELKSDLATAKNRAERIAAVKKADKARGKMGGGMMMKAPGYKKGKSVMAKGCKLGRKKPTKMYT